MLQSNTELALYFHISVADQQLPEGYKIEPPQGPLEAIRCDGSSNSKMNTLRIDSLV